MRKLQIMMAALAMTVGISNIAMANDNKHDQSKEQPKDDHKDGHKDGHKK